MAIVFTSTFKRRFSALLLSIYMILDKRLYLL